ncbi:MAG: AAA family ATPase, partial [Chloroflexi bacterium]
MRIVADLHIHSHYSRATSKDLTFEHLARWAQLKGVHVVGTGDIAHPGWLEEMKEKLEPAEEGLFRLKADIARQVEADIPPACRGPVRFMLAGEISSIYKKNDRVRKIHNVIFAPTLTAVEKIQAELEKIGNIRSDGRPILGLDSRDLLEIILTIHPQNYLIPAHIWTPWFSLLGSKSGFDSVEECFADLTPHIFALETGLSSDPPMNWRVSSLDRYTLVSNSDAHSPQKLAREANLFNTDLSYPAIFDALKTGHPDTFLGTIEFFPEEGKYHLDGHRKCNLRWKPRDTLAHNGLCPVCGKPVTVGVLHRVETLADRPEGGRPDRVPPFHSLIPLPEVLSEVHGVGPGSKRVRQAYEALLARLGPELDILLTVPLADIEQAGGSLLAEGIRRMRAGQVIAQGGFDGEYGVVRLFEPEERAGFAGQLSLFAPPQRQHQADRPAPPPADLQQVAMFRETPAPTPSSAPSADPPPAGDPVLDGLNPEQRAAVLCTDRSLLVVAGPGTGKTRVLTHRIAYLVRHRQVNPESILAITFTNKAAAEMSARLTALLGPTVARKITVKTFHAFGAMILRQNAPLLDLPATFALCTDDDRRDLLSRLYPTLSEAETDAYLSAISAAKNRLETPGTMTAPAELVDPPLAEVYRRYQEALHQSRLLDYDDLLARTIALFETHPDRLDDCRRRFRWISVD